MVPLGRASRIGASRFLNCRGRDARTGFQCNMVTSRAPTTSPPAPVPFPATRRTFGRAAAAAAAKRCNAAGVVVSAAAAASSPAAATAIEVATLAPPATATGGPSPSAVSAADIAQRFRVVPVAQQFRETRQKVCREFLAGGLLYLEAGEAPPRNGSDVFHRHRSNSYFVYVTGVELPGYAALVDAETGHYTLLAPRLPEEAAYWVGAVPSLDQLQEQYGADSVCYTDELPKLLAARATSAAPSSLDVHTLPSSADRLRSQAPSGCRVTCDLLPATLDRCRAVKTDAEVGCLLEASRISGAAHLDMWRACRPGLLEYQLEAVFSHSSRCRGAPAAGYPPIVGSGPNAAVMHYEASEGRVEAGHLVLVDAGAEWRCYTADISRTFPASGRFDGAARDLYGTVLAAQYAALDVLSYAGSGGCAPTLQEADQRARRVLLEGLADMGLVRRGAGGGGSHGAWLDAALELKVDRVFMPHGLGHHLGLDVHDVSDSGPVPKGRLQPGFVLTVEPGAYLIPPLLAKARADPRVGDFLDLDAAESLVRAGLGGVRIEDNVVVLEGLDAGAGKDAGGGEREAGKVVGLQGRLFNLTVAAGVVKEVGEVEEVMRQEWRPELAMLGC